MIKRRELQECNELFELLSHPSVFPFVRQKAKTADEFWFMTSQLMEDEENGKVVSRTITDDWGQPIGTITLYDVQDGAGFLGTWIGAPYQGKGYNQKAKELFLKELFFELDFQCVFLKIRKEKRTPQRPFFKLSCKAHAPCRRWRISEGSCRRSPPKRCLSQGHTKATIRLPRSWCSV